MKRVIIVHGWGGHSNEAWLPWLKKELEAKGFTVSIPQMPDTDHPVIDKWVGKLNEVVGTVDENTYLVGHSVGCQTILRYLQGVDGVVGGAVFVAGWLHLKEDSYENDEEREIAKPWIETPIDWKNVKAHCKKFVSLFSDDDYFVPLSDAQIFRENLGGIVIIEKGKGHFSSEEKMWELPVVLDAVLGMED